MYTPLPLSSEVFEQLNWSDIEPWYRELVATPLSQEILLPWLAQWSRLSEFVDETAMRLEIAWAQDTTDPKRAQRKQIFSETIGASAQIFEQQIRQQLLASGLVPEGFALPLRNLRAQAALFCEENLPLAQEEQRLYTSYEQMRSAQMIAWKGKETPLSFLLEQSDRQQREQGWYLMRERLLLDRTRLDTLWRENVRIRQQMAQNAGYDHYRDYRWQQLLRFDYTPADCLTFHTAIEQVVVPIASQLWEKRRKLLGVETLRPWDLEYDPRDAAPLPFSSDSKILQEQCAALFGCIDPHLASYVETMIHEQLLDLDVRPGKANMNYLLPLPASRRAFLFANLGGSVRDIFVFLHEAGHAFHEFEMNRLPYLHQRKDGFLPLEFMEVASTSMEFIGPMHLHAAQLCSQEEEDRLCVRRLERTGMYWLPNSARIDAFQHWVYTHPSQAMDLQACGQVWAELSKRYLPWIDWSGLEDALCSEWQQSEYIYGFPFYFIEYAIAALGALQIWRNYRQDPQATLQRYRSALALGATKTVPELFAAAGATFAFDKATLQATMHLLMRAIEERETKR